MCWNPQGQTQMYKGKICFWLCFILFVKWPGVDGERSGQVKERKRKKKKEKERKRKKKKRKEKSQEQIMGKDWQCITMETNQVSLFL